MSQYAVNREMVFTGGDLARPRMAVEKEKVDTFFPSFDFYGTDTEVKSLRGAFRTSYGNRYDVKVEIPSDYPYRKPTINVTNCQLDGPHLYKDNSICIMTSDQWSTTLSLAFVLAKTAKWLNKHDYWRRNGKWPGNQQSH